MKHFLFIRSCRKDLDWCELCLRCIFRFAEGFDGVILTFPFEDLHAFHPMVARNFRVHTEAKTLKLVPVQRMPNDYIGQQCSKLHADLQTGNDCWITYLDSDAMLTGTLRPEMLFAPVDEPLWPITLYDPAILGDAMCWKAPTERYLKREGVNYEYMRRLLLTVHSDHLGELRRHMLKLHGQHLSGLMRNVTDKAFSEFNLMGAFLHEAHPEAYHFYDTQQEAHDPLPFKQYWSWGGLQPDHIVEINAAIHGTPPAPTPADIIGKAFLGEFGGRPETGKPVTAIDFGVPGGDKTVHTEGHINVEGKLVIDKMTTVEPEPNPEVGF